MGISVVFPAYNEEGNIHATVGRALEALRSLVDEFEIIIVNDSSTDATGRIADGLALQYPEIRVIHNVKNLGQGASIILGFRQARYDLVIHNAMDYPFDLKDLGRMLAVLKGAEIVVAVRRRRAGYTLSRKVMSVVNIMLLRVLFGVRLRDCNFVQLYRKHVWDSVQIESRSTAFLTPEALIRAHDMGFRIEQVVVEYHPREAGKATSGSFRVIFSSVRDMFRFWWNRTIRHRSEYRAQCQKRGLGGT
jgi:glycosyltransferase involved in cell wall biosynthesis